MIPKFRVYNKTTKLMYPVKFISYPLRTVRCINKHGLYLSEETFYLTREEIVLMQSTGLKDKNGVEVFDGDIMFYEQDCYQYTLVKYDKDKLAFVLYDGCERLYHELWEPGEVIGNIYENPELLESVEE